MEKQKNEWFEWLKAIVIAVALAGGIRYFIFAPIIVEGESMMPTLHNQDRMIVNKIAYKIGEPERFDIIVFHAEEGKDYIKRIRKGPIDDRRFAYNFIHWNKADMTAIFAVSTIISEHE